MLLWLLDVESSSGKQIIALKVPIAKISETVGLLSVAPRVQIPGAAISFDVAPGVSLNQARDAIEQASGAVNFADRDCS